jgi:hypothetical protein
MESQGLLADDLLESIAEIAAFTGWSERRCYHLAEKRLIPLFKIGGRWTGRKSTLRRHLDRLEAGETV